MKVPRDDTGPAGSLYIPASFSEEAAKGATRYIQGEKGYEITRERPSTEELADLKEEALRRYSFVQGDDLDQLVLWHREKVALFPEWGWFAYRNGEFVAMSALEEVDPQTLLLSSGYSRAPSAVAALTAVRIAWAEQHGYTLMRARVFRRNQGGTLHLERWGFQKTGDWEMAQTSENEIDIWEKPLRTHANISQEARSL